MCCNVIFFFFSSRRRHTRFSRDWSSDVCSSDLDPDRITSAPVEEERRPAGYALAAPRDAHSQQLPVRNDETPGSVVAGASLETQPGVIHLELARMHSVSVHLPGH